jgi:hypothetical protein
LESSSLERLMFTVDRMLPLRRRRLEALATALEEQLGAERAVRAIRNQIAVADRRGRELLYALHDEIARRHHWWSTDR